MFKKPKWAYLPFKFTDSWPSVAVTLIFIPLGIVPAKVSSY